MPKSGLRKINCYSDDFKATAVKLSSLPEVLIQDVAEALDIHPFMLSRCRKEMREGRIVVEGKKVEIDSRTARELKRLGNYSQIGVCIMAISVRKSRMKEVPLSEVKDDLSRFLHEAEKHEIVITRHGKPAVVLIGFESEEDWFDYKLENDPRFLERVEWARRSLRVGRGTRLEDIPE